MTQATIDIISHLGVNFIGLEVFLGAPIAQQSNKPGNSAKPKTTATAIAKAIAFIIRFSPNDAHPSTETAQTTKNSIYKTKTQRI